MRPATALRVVALLILGGLSVSATDAIGIEAEVEPIAGNLQIVLEASGVIRTGKWTKVRAVLTNDTGIPLHDIEALLCAESDVLEVRDGWSVVVRDLEPGVSVKVKWSVRSDEEGNLVVMATAQATTEGGNLTVSESDAGVLHVVAGPASP